MRASDFNAWKEWFQYKSQDFQPGIQRGYIALSTKGLVTAEVPDYTRKFEK